VGIYNSNIFIYEDLSNTNFEAVIINSSLFSVSSIFYSFFWSIRNIC